MLLRRDVGSFEFFMCFALVLLWEKMWVFCVVCVRESVCVELRLHPALGTSKEFCPRFSTRAFFRQTSDWQPAKQQVAQPHERATMEAKPDLGWGDRWDDQARDRMDMYSCKLMCSECERT